MSYVDGGEEEAKCCKKKKDCKVSFNPFKIHLTAIKNGFMHVDRTIHRF